MMQPRNATTGFSKAALTLGCMHSAIVTAMLALVRYLVWRIALPRTGYELRLMMLDVKQALELRRRMLGRPKVRAAMWRMLCTDLATLPAFLIFAALDLARMVERRLWKVADPPVRPPDTFSYPAYYLYNFHHQVNGNLSWRAAVSYEWQLRVLFMGCNHLMRQGVVDEVPEGEGLTILDVACGTGKWVAQARMQGRQHNVIGIDLSGSALRRARNDEHYNEVHQMNAEELDPSWAGRFDIVTCVWLFHELPSAAQDNVTAEIARVLRPGGLLVFMDALQWNQDAPDLFPQMGGKSIFSLVFNEPYFNGYLDVDLVALFARHGMQLQAVHHYFKSKVLVVAKSNVG